MKRINDENIDEIMFQLLEGEITGAEREYLLEAIEADESYSKLWKAWQQTILQPAAEMVVMDIKKLKKKSARIIPLHYKYAIAAMLVLACGLSVFFYNRPQNDTMVTEAPKPARTKQPVRQVPKPDLKSENDPQSDSIIPLKEKIRTMAEKSKPELGNDEPAEHLEFIPEPVKVPVQAPERIAVKDPQPAHAELKKPNVPVEEDHIIVTMSSDSKPARTVAETTEPQSRERLLTRLFGKPKFKFENDSNTRTNKRLIIENKQYKIIAGF